MSKIKLAVGAGLAAFFILSTGVFTAGSLARGKKQAPPEPVQAMVDPILDVSEVSKHNTKDDCWLIISGNVYNLTKFLAQHPGGSKPIIPYCGVDGTEAFSTKDLDPARGHSKLAEELLAQYLIGKIGEPLTPESGPLPNLVGPLPTAFRATGPQVGIGTSVAVLAMSDVSRHNSTSSCWIVVSGGVYDVTGYLFSHPGGSGAIISYCGKEATAAFQTKDKSPGTSHSTFAYGLLAQYLIGNLGSPLAQLLPTTAPITVPTGVPNIVSPTLAPGGSNLTITSSVVALHNTAQNCWLIISGKVYDVTKFIYQHPGGAQAIIKYCGQDGTVGFQTKDKGSPKDHSNDAYNMLNSYFVGNLGSTVSINPPVAAPTNTPKPEGEKNTASIPDSVTSKYPGATITSQEVEDDGRQDIKLLYNGECRHIKTNKDGSIKEDKDC